MTISLSGSSIACDNKSPFRTSAIKNLEELQKMRKQQEWQIKNSPLQPSCFICPYISEKDIYNLQSITTLISHPINQKQTTHILAQQYSAQDLYHLSNTPVIGHPAALNYCAAISYLARQAYLIRATQELHALLIKKDK